MNQQEVFNRLQNIIMPYLENPYQIGLETDLIKDLAINSVEFASAIVEVEDEFMFSISDEEMFNIRSIKDVINLIRNLK